MVRAEIITIGDEILYGQILDTNTQWISLELDKIGIKTIRKSSVGDQDTEILAILEEAQHRADIVFITGGLGPTKDDLTKNVLAKFFDSDMDYHPQALEDVRVFFEKRGRELSDLNRDQALLPVKAQYIQNKQGTAPGMWFEEKGTIWVSMAGVPFEMKAMMEELVLPRVAQHFKTPTIVHKIVKVVGIGESYLSDMIQDWELSLPSHIKLAYLPSLGIVKLRLTGFGSEAKQIQQDIQREIDRVMPLIKGYVFGYEQDELSEVVGKLLIAQSANLAVAESCTGGYLSHLFTEIPGSSAYIVGGVISYANEVKMESLGVSSQILEQDGAVSEACIVAMAQGVREKLKSSVSLATSGIAGPDGGSEDKPVGTVWIALAHSGGVITRKLQLAGTRKQIIHMTALNCLNLLRKFLLNELTQ
ncbi:competence/damage-inducible protein A [Aquirufa rosea]|uniref:CinA-like protein n=1 Tax=Aquirufa rosea TaxID=2509241 RepID=A0A4Q1C2D8_9BACT|nr:competence/damage-inducible protein A [Aquirufa rosea]RXK52346.1 competence/damage-inducible protein A [Aquirufa rosea]